MALSYLTDINLNKNELQNAVIQKLATDPSSGQTAGWLIYNTASNQLKVYDGTDWTNVGGDITGVNITAGTGLTGTVSTTSGQHTQTIDLADTAVTPGSYGSSTAIPVITVDQQGRLTAATTAAISTDLTIAADSGSNDIVSIGADTLTFAGTTNEIETTVSNNQIQIGLPDDVTIGNDLTVTGSFLSDDITAATVTINGNLTVTGTQTTTDSTV